MSLFFLCYFISLFFYIFSVWKKVGYLDGLSRCRTRVGLEYVFHLEQCGCFAVSWEVFRSRLDTVLGSQAEVALLEQGLGRVTSRGPFCSPSSSVSLCKGWGRKMQFPADQSVWQVRSQMGSSGNKQARLALFSVSRRCSQAPGSQQPAGSTSFSPPYLYFTLESVICHVAQQNRCISGSAYPHMPFAVTLNSDCLNRLSLCSLFVWIGPGCNFVWGFCTAGHGEGFIFEPDFSVQGK